MVFAFFSKNERDGVLKTIEDHVSETSSTSYRNEAYHAYEEDRESTHSNRSRSVSIKIICF